MHEGANQGQQVRCVRACVRACFGLLVLLYCFSLVKYVLHLWLVLVCASRFFKAALYSAHTHTHTHTHTQHTHTRAITHGRPNIDMHIHTCTGPHRRG